MNFSQFDRPALHVLGGTVLEHFAAAFPHLPLETSLSQALQSMPIESVCGADCIAAIDGAKALAAAVLMATADTAKAEEIAGMAADACGVFICG